MFENQKKCPICGRLYRADTTRCEDCGVVLTAIEPHQPIWQPYVPPQGNFPRRQWQNPGVVYPNHPHRQNVDANAAARSQKPRMGVFLMGMLLIVLVALLVVLLIWRMQVNAPVSDSQQNIAVIATEGSAATTASETEPLQTQQSTGSVTESAETVTQSEPQASPDLTDPVIQTMGSTNIINGGYACQDAEYRYLNQDGILYRMPLSAAEDGQTMVPLVYEEAYYMNLVDDRLYFVSADRNNAICSVAADGSDLTVVYDVYCYELTYCDGWFYFSRVDGNARAICRMRPDGSELTELYTCEAWYMNISGGQIYFCNFSDGLALYAMSLDGSDVRVVYDGVSSDLCVADDVIYFSADRTSRRLYRIHTDGTGLTLVYDGYARYTNFSNDRLYFTNETGILYSCRADGSGVIMLTPNAVTYPLVFSDVIYFETQSGTLASFSYEAP